MYHLYHTRAFVLASTPSGEAHKFFTLFTEELGLVTASATSVREERSKLRYGLQDFSLSEVTLVRGRENWRLANAELIENLYAVFREEPETSAMFRRIFRLLRRLLPGEEKNMQLFSTLLQALHFLKESKGSAEGAALVEIVLVLRLLFLLGYLAPRGELETLFHSPFLLDDEALALARRFRTLAVASINHSLRATQL